MKTSTLLTYLAGACLLTASAQAVVVLETDFISDSFGATGVSSTIAGMTGVVWTENGLTAPTSLTGSNVIKGDQSGVDAVSGFFSVNTNVNSTTESSPAWFLTFTVTVGGVDIDLTDIILDTIETNSSGQPGAGNGDSDIKLTIYDNTEATSIFSQTLTRTDNSNIQSLTYTTPVTLTATQTYDMTFTLWETDNTSSGHFEGFDSLTFNAVPEPSAFALLAGCFGLTWAMLRRRAR